MANTKNTIQNISLTGPLCLNKLKTDVTQFEGYNEKNTTVFGGELIPLWESVENIDSCNYSQTVINSNGKKFIIKPNIESGQGGIHLYGPDGEITDPLDDNYTIPHTIKLNLPSDAIWGGMFVTSGNNLLEVYLTEGFVLKYRSASIDGYEGRYSKLDKYIETLPWEPLYDITGGQDHPYKLIGVIGGYNNGKLSLYIFHKRLDYESAYLFIGEFNYSNNGYLGVGTTNHPTIFDRSDSYFNVNGNMFFTVDDSPLEQEYDKAIYFVYSGTDLDGKGDENSHPLVKVLRRYAGTYEWVSSPSEVDAYLPMNIAPVDDEELFIGSRTEEIYPTANKPSTAPYYNYSLSPYAARNCCFASQDRQGYANVMTTSFSGSLQWQISGHDGSGFVPTMFESGTQSLGSFNFICLNGDLMAVTYGGVHINSPTTFTSNYVTISKPFGIGHGMCVNYGANNEWYCFLSLSSEAARMFSSYDTEADGFYGGGDLMKSQVIDNRYILMLNIFPEKTFIYDIEKEKIVTTGRSLGYVDTSYPIADDISNESYGAVFASGFNAGYAQSGASFVGYLANPSVMTYFPSKNVGAMFITPGKRTPDDIQFYCSVGESIQSAEYIGSNTLYTGTYYPIDTNGNIILPLAINNQIINGYSNNDMVKSGTTAYPLMYYNNNQKIYAYQLLSSIENMEGVFSLQGRRYVVDDNNIYSVTYDGGVISSAEPVCYKKNLMFLGTLPTSAIFYSSYNKTFYQFTGDAIMSKMFEANDINEIKFVSQNPSTLSLWICTDACMYVMSETDMFRLDGDVVDVYFQPTRTIYVTKENPSYFYNITKEHVLSFYKVSDNQTEVPVKLATKYYGLGSELKATFDCWYIRLHSSNHKNGKLIVKVNTITNTSFETEEKVFEINKNMYDANDQIYIRYQPKYQTAVAMQLELESDIAIYQISLGVNATDAVTQQSKFNF